MMDYDQEVGTACVTLIVGQLEVLANTGELDAWYAPRDSQTGLDGLEELISDLFVMWGQQGAG